MPTGNAHRLAPKRLAPKRLAIARLSHEGNSFSPLLTGHDDFARREWVVGAAARAFYRGSRSELGAAVGFLEARPGWDGSFLRCAAAPPGGLVGSALLCVKAKNHFRAAFAQRFRRLVDADTPGPAALDLAKLRFRQVPTAHLPPYDA